MPTPEEAAAAAQQQKDAAAVAEATHLLKVKLELEEMNDEAEMEIQVLKTKQLELAHQAKVKRREILKKALDEGLSSDKLPELDFTTQAHPLPFLPLQFQLRLPPLQRRLLPHPPFPIPSPSVICLNSLVVRGSNFRRPLRKKSWITAIKLTFALKQNLGPRCSTFKVSLLRTSLLNFKRIPKVRLHQLLLISFIWMTRNLL